MKLAKLCSLVGWTLLMFTASVSAQATKTYPERPIKIVVPYTPGAINDVLARAMGAELSKQLDQTVIVENRPGAGSVIGTNYVAQAAPDGYTILQVPPAFAINAALRANMPYDAEKDFELVTLAAVSPLLLVVNATSDYKTFGDLINMAKQNPGKLTYASTGAGGSAHMMGEMLRGMAGIDVLHVPYKGAAPAITDLAGGRVDFSFTTSTAAAAVLSSGLVRALAITSNQPSSSFPDLKPIAALGYPNYNASAWWAYAVPKGTPRSVIDTLNNAINNVLENDAFAKRFLSEGMDIVGGTPETATKFVKDDIALWHTVVKELDIEKLGS